MQLGIYVFRIDRSTPNAPQKRRARYEPNALWPQVNQYTYVPMHKPMQLGIHPSVSTRQLCIYKKLKLRCVVPQNVVTSLGARAREPIKPLLGWSESQSNRDRRREIGRFNDPKGYRTNGNKRDLAAASQRQLTGPRNKPHISPTPYHRQNRRGPIMYVRYPYSCQQFYRVKG